jgi:hypothetical protein
MLRVEGVAFVGMSLGPMEKKEMEKKEMDKKGKRGISKGRTP